jgi:hypothetical protein
LRSSLQTIGVWFLLAAFSSSCGQFLGNLRRDINDDGEAQDSRPTVGGRWTEGGMLTDSGRSRSFYDDYDRAPASSSIEGPKHRSWTAPEQPSGDADDMVTFSNTPTIDPPTKRMYKNGRRATKADFVDESESEGSLWATGGQTNYYFTKNKIRSAGDIISIAFEADLIKDLGLEFRRTLTSREKEIELALAQERIRATMLGSTDTVNSSSAAPQRAPAATPAQPPAPGAPAADGTAQTGDKKSADDIDVPTATLNDVDVSKSIDVKPGDIMMGEIVERYPNGNYKVRATKKIPYKNGAPRLVNLTGVVRGTDINDEDIIQSGKLYEYRVEAIR